MGKAKKANFIQNSFLLANSVNLKLNLQVVIWNLLFVIRKGGEEILTTRST
ncbi:MAG: hypothetical protein RLZZ507_1391 [Cyanobacteriota bacterium]|jgi:hypothetical protein